MMDYSITKAMRHLCTLPCPCQRCKEERMLRRYGYIPGRTRASAGNGELRRPGPERERDNDNDNGHDSDMGLNRFADRAPYGPVEDGCDETCAAPCTNRTEPCFTLPQQAATSDLSGVPGGTPREYGYSGSWARDSGCSCSPRRTSARRPGTLTSEDGYNLPSGYRPPPNSNRNSSLRSASRASRGSHTSLGFDIFGNEQISQILTFIVEILGVLMFFTVCTVSFWITLGYYIVKLCIDFKSADKWVKTAVAILVGVLLIAFLVTVATDREGRFCCTRKARVRSNWIPNCFPRVKAWFGQARPAGCKAAATAVRLKSVCPRANPPSCSSCSATNPFRKFLSMIWPLNSKPLAPACPNAKAPSSTILSRIWPQKCKPLPGKKPIKCWLGKCEIKGATCPKQVRYTDQQGRAIFLNSKRYAIPCEMKQPPAVIVWLYNMIVNMWGD